MGTNDAFPTPLGAAKRAAEHVRLTWEGVILRPRSGAARILGKGNAVRVVPLDAPGRRARPGGPAPGGP
jgi:hypothetical protein